MRLVATQAQDRVVSVYGATFGSVETVGRRWGHCAGEAGWGVQSQIHVVADGAEWIPIQSRESFGKKESFLFDFFRANEYLADSAESCRPKAPSTWGRTQQKRLKRGAIAGIFKELDAHREPGFPKMPMPSLNSPKRQRSWAPALELNLSLTHF